MANYQQAKSGVATRDGEFIYSYGVQRNLLNGAYEVIPYLLIKHEAIPVELLDSLGENLEALGPNYLSMPMLREGGRFEITE